MLINEFFCWKVDFVTFDFVNTSKALLFDSTFCFSELGEGGLQVGLRTGRRAVAGKNLILGETRRWPFSFLRNAISVVSLHAESPAFYILYVRVLIRCGRSYTRLITWLTCIQSRHLLWCKNRAVFWCRCQIVSSLTVVVLSATHQWTLWGI